MKISEYKTTCANLPEDLQEFVNGWIVNGWQPLGAPVVFNTTLVQAMVKFGEDCDHSWSDFPESPIADAVTVCLKCGAIN